VASKIAERAPFMDSLKVQLRILWALFMREVLTRYGRHNIGFLWLFVEPMIFTLGVTLLWTVTRWAHGSGMPIVAFALTGYSSVLLWRNMPGRCIGALEGSLSLLYHRNIRVLDIYLARLMLEFGGATISFTTLSLLFISIGWVQPPHDLLEVVGGWLVIAWFGSALAVWLGALSHEYELVDKIWHPAAYLIFPLSGSAFMVDALPKYGQYYILFVPMVHGVEIVREGYFGASAHAHYNLGYILPLSLFITALALFQVRRIARTVVPA
jgi:ABC-2 type transport system permease protein/capsular polysaccharide transport system permease protein